VIAEPNECNKNLNAFHIIFCVKVTTFCVSFEQHAQSTVVRLLQMHFLKYIFIKTLSLQVGYILSASKDIYGFNAFMFQTFSFVELI